MFKPRPTHCNSGHEWTDKNSYVYVDAGGYTRRKCRQCTLLHLKKHRRAAGIKQRKLKVKVPSRTPEGDLTLEATEIVRANRIAVLIDKKWRASTSWERADVQAEIDALKHKDSA